MACFSKVSKHDSHCSYKRHKKALSYTTQRLAKVLGDFSSAREIDRVYPILAVSAVGVDGRWLCRLLDSLLGACVVRQ
jgi:hypothetical protein